MARTAGPVEEVPLAGRAQVLSPKHVVSLPPAAEKEHR